MHTGHDQDERRKNTPYAEDACKVPIAALTRTRMMQENPMQCDASNAKSSYEDKHKVKRGPIGSDCQIQRTQNRTLFTSFTSFKAMPMCSDSSAIPVHPFLQCHQTRTGQQYFSVSMDHRGPNLAKRDLVVGLGLQPLLRPV